MDKLAYLFIASILVLAACSNEGTKDEEINTPETSTETPAQVTTPATEIEVQPAAEVVLNPAHGEPGHDCAVAVGAPLNSPAGQQATPQVQQVQPNLNTQPQLQAPPAQNASGQKLNPPHGEPGHDCAVAVGAPLNSPAGQQPTIQTQQVQPNLNTQPQLQAQPTENAQGQKLNPPHGEPGHDCALAVGAPLPN